MNARSLAAGATLAALGLAALAVAGGDDGVSRGGRLFYAHGCHGCHTIAGAGSPIGPDLSAVGRRRSEAWLARWLTNPEGERPGAHMPKLGLDAADTRALASFLSTRRGTR
jgi:mono/diheme cytochrome c family protein